MAKKNEETKDLTTLGGETKEPAKPVTKRDVFIENMRKKHPEITDEDELYGKAMENYDGDHEYRKKQTAANKQFGDIIEKEPEVADFFRKTIEGGDAGVAMLGLSDLYQSYMRGEIDSEKFKSARAEREAKKKAQDEADKVQEQAYRDWCSKKGYDPVEWMTKANDQLFKPMSEHALAEAQFDMLDKMMNYDSDVETARVQGRNENITAQKREMAKPKTDGMPTSGGADIPQGGSRSSAMQNMADARRMKRNQL